MLYTYFKFLNDSNNNFEHKNNTLNDISYLYNYIRNMKYYHILCNTTFFYPYNFNIKSNSDLNNFNQLQIRQEVFDPLDKILTIIQNNNINILFNNIKKIPLNNIEMKLELYNHKYIKNKTINVFNFSKTYKSEKKFKNYIYDILSYNNSIDTNHSFIVYYYINTIFSKYIETRLTYGNLLRQEIIELNKLHEHVSFNDISSLFDFQEFNNLFISISLNGTYNLSTLCPSLLSSIQLYLQNNELDHFKETINTFFNLNNYNFINKLLNNIIKLCNEKLTNNITNSFLLVKNSYLTNNIYSEKNIKHHENIILNNYKLNINDITFRNHKYILDFYRFDFNKFINIIQIVSEDYINTNVKGDNIYSMSPQQFESILKNFNLDFTNFSDFLNIINPIYDNNYIVYDIILNNDSELLKYAIKLTYLEYVELFLESNEFNELIEDMLYSIYIYLKNNGIIEYHYNWLYNKCNIINFIHIWLKKEVIKDNFNIDLKLELINNIENIIKYPNQYINDDINLQYFNNIINNIQNFDYKQMHIFFENMISSVLSKILHDDILLKYKI